MLKTVRTLLVAARHGSAPEFAASDHLIRTLFRLGPLFYLVGLLVWLFYRR